MFKKHYLLSIILITFLSACVNRPDDDSLIASPENLSLALEQVIDNVVLVAVDDFFDSANDLNNSAGDFCTFPTEENLSTVQQQWRHIFEQWYRLSNYNFGPLDDDLVFPTYTFIDSLRLRGKDYTETIRTEISNDIASSDILDADYFSRKTFNKVGLLALESSLFETASAEHSQIAADIVAEYQFAPRKCEILMGLANQIVVRAQTIQAGWNVSYKDSTESYRTIFLNDQLDDGTEPLTQLIISIQEWLDYLQKRQVVITAAQLSAHAWLSIEVSINELELLLDASWADEADSEAADNDEQASISFFALMEAAGYQNAVDTVKENIAAIQQNIEDRDTSMLEISLGKLDGNFKREIPDSLDIELGINFSDGD